MANGYTFLKLPSIKLACTFIIPLCPQALLNEIIVEESALRRDKKLPTEAAPPHHQARDLGRLGTVDADAMEIKAKEIFSTSELRAKAEVALQRRATAGISDSVEDMQPIVAPPFDSAMVGKHIEVCVLNTLLV